jgi:ribosome-associated translation inhibitor RaiA
MATSTTHIELHASDDLPPRALDAARHRIATLARHAGGRDLQGRIRLRSGPKGRAVADASVTFEGRLLAAHASAPTPSAAVDAVVSRLERQLRRVVDAGVALRNEPRVLASALAGARDDPPHRPAQLKPPEQRKLVVRHTYAPEPRSTVSAIADLLDLDFDFYLFVHARTNEDVVVHWRDDGRIGLLFPQGSALADEDDIVVPEPSRYSGPLTLDAALAEMDLLNHRFLYFTDASDGRGRVLYLRHDGDYGLVEPP